MFYNLIKFWEQPSCFSYDFNYNFFQARFIGSHAIAPRSKINGILLSHMLERSPVSAVMLEADFCSRLVGWGDWTPPNDTTPMNTGNISQSLFPPPSLQSFQKTPSSWVLFLCSHPSMRSQELCLTFGTGECGEVSAKWP